MHYEDILEIVEKFRPMVYRIAIQNTGDIHLSEDITQNVFIKLIESDKTFESEEHLKAWLAKVTINEARSYFRLFFVRKSVPLPEDDSLIGTYEYEYINLFNEINKMKKDYKNVLYLHCYEGYTVPEIARMLNKNVNTVSTWLRRAKDELKTILNIEEENENG